ncbi:MAG TPA: c-type cytochrome [Sphingomonas sp.]|nr:c-type cytochrome [Sphingomonas sp.]
MNATTGAFGAMILAAAATAAIAAQPGAKSSGDPVAGSKTFATRCAMCHGKAGVGTGMAPALRGAFGAKAGAANSPRNSAALKASKLTWNAGNLDAYLAAPAKLVPGTNMPIAVANPKDRQNLIAYLATLKK